MFEDSEVITVYLDVVMGWDWARFHSVNVSLELVAGSVELDH
jgi:hypothetical protein